MDGMFVERFMTTMQLPWALTTFHEMFHEIFHELHAPLLTSGLLFLDGCVDYLD